MLVQQLSLSLLLLSGPVGMALGPVAGGVSGSLLGHRDKQWKLGARRTTPGAGDDAEDGVKAGPSAHGGP